MRTYPGRQAVAMGCRSTWAEHEYASRWPEVRRRSAETDFSSAESIFHPGRVGDRKEESCVRFASLGEASLLLVVTHEWDDVVHLVLPQ